MFFPSELGSEFVRLAKPYWESKEDDSARMRMVWNILTGLQGVVLGHMLVQRIGNKVFAGPFRGMTIIQDVMDRHFAPYLLGTYEWELHGAIEEVISKKYKYIVNVGSSFGYYAVGLALRMPDTTIYAYDIDPIAREQCQKMAKANNVEDRVIIREEFTKDECAQFSGSDSFLFMDVESCEDELLNPESFPEERHMDVIVEMHDCIKRGLSTAIPLRFAATHHVRVIPNMPFSFPLEKVLGPGYVPDHFDNLIATWEGRGGPTPFGVFIRK